MAILTRFDAVTYLDSEDVIAAYLEAVRESGDSALMRRAEADVARARRLASPKRPGEG
jgi:DNA-binding phage protein